MNTIRHLTWGYARLLKLYPPDFQAEFSEEMADVFARALRDVSRGGWRSIIVVCLRELVEFPKNLWQEYTSRLRKGFVMNTQSSVFEPKHAAPLGSLGFGLGFALLILLRLLIDPANSAGLINFSPIWIRETLLFMLIGALGGGFIGAGSHSTRLMIRFTLAGTLSCGLAGSLGTLFLHLYYRFGMNGDVHRAPLLNNLMVALVIIFIGSLTGIALGVALGDRRRAVRLAWVGALGFGGADLLGQITFGIARIFWMSTVFSELWFIPLAFSSMITGLVGGAVLGWAIGQKGNSSPTPIAG